VVSIDVPLAIGESRVRWFVAVAMVCGLAMSGAIAVAQRRRRGVAVAVAALPRRESEELLQAIATLDAAFERSAAPTADERSRYEAERAQLKTRLGAALAAERPTG
jgi:hypothetical protein